MYYVSQEKYIEDIVKAAGQDDAKVSSIPMDPGYHRLSEGAPYEDQARYQKLVGMLLYLTTNTRPDIATSVSILSQKVSQPSKTDWTELVRLVRYLKGSKSLRLKLSGAVSDLCGHSDASWGEDRKDRKSNTGYVLEVNGGTVKSRAW